MDYIPPNNDNLDCAEVKEVAFPRKPWLIIYSLVLLTVLIAGGSFAFKFAKKADNTKLDVAILAQDQSQIVPVKQADKVADIIAKNTPTPPPAIAAEKPLVVTVKAKDHLGRIFKRNGLSTKTANDIVALKQAKALRSLSVGRKMSLVLDATKTKLQELSYEVNALDTIVVSAAKNGWRVETKHIEPFAALKYAAATVNGSVYTAAKNAGISRKLTAKFVNVLDSQINTRKICNGDHIALFYKEYTVGDKKVRDDELAAAELVHKGKKYRVIGFTDSKGHTEFYTPSGHNIKPSFIRYPLTNFNRISSRFSYGREHPILNGVTRPHLGVDFSAQRGTPVKATSDGKIAFMGNHSGHGRTVVVKHGPYSSLYAHLSRFGKNVFSGKYVRQGEVIGYVGATGLATGPHLHYEFRVNGAHRDPLKVKLPAGDMIDAKYRSKFFAQSKNLLAQLDMHHKTDHRMYAMNSKGQPKFE